MHLALSLYIETSTNLYISCKGFQCSLSMMSCVYRPCERTVQWSCHGCQMDTCRLHTPLNAICLRCYSPLTQVFDANSTNPDPTSSSAPRHECHCCPCRFDDPISLREHISSVHPNFNQTTGNVSPIDLDSQDS